MSTYGDLLAEFIAARDADENAMQDGTWTASIGVRRLAATANFHRVDVAKSRCQCEACGEHARLVRETRRHS